MLHAAVALAGNWRFAPEEFRQRPRTAHPVRQPYPPRAVLRKDGVGGDPYAGVAESTLTG